MTKTIKWVKRGESHVGRAGDQQFTAMADGVGAWLLCEVKPDGVGELLAHNLPDEITAMIVALDHVKTGIATLWLMAVLLTVVLLSILVVVSAYAPV